MSGFDGFAYLTLAFVLGVPWQLARVAIGLKKKRDKDNAAAEKSRLTQKSF